MWTGKSICRYLSQGSRFKFSWPLIVWLFTCGSWTPRHSQESFRRSDRETQNLKTELGMYAVFIFFFFFRRRTYVNPLHKPYYNSLINIERKITTIIWVICLIRVTNKSVITGIIIHLCQRAKWQPTCNRAAPRAGEAPCAAQHPLLSCLHVALSS